jgi:membrane protein implicated in regulation of membrane protease activity
MASVWQWGCCSPSSAPSPAISSAVADIGTDGHAEAGFADSGLPGISFFSPTVLASFVTAFGACGLILKSIEATSPLYISAPVSAMAGGVIALLVFWVFNAMFSKTQSSSESKVRSLVGHTASVITPIPESGVGEIAYIQGGTRYTAPARSVDSKAVGVTKGVRIAKIVGTQFYVEVID